MHKAVPKILKNIMVAHECGYATWLNTPSEKRPIAAHIDWRRLRMKILLGDWMTILAFIKIKQNAKANPQELRMMT
jgi:hypothetical protein